MTCRDCGTEFKVKKVKRGYIDQCDSCSQDNVRRYVGRRYRSGKDDVTELHVVRDEVDLAKSVQRLDNLYCLNV